MNDHPYFLPSEVRVLHEVATFLMIYGFGSICYAYGSSSPHSHPVLNALWRFLFKPLWYLSIGFLIWARYY
jgi:hypothetical protein